MLRLETLENGASNERQQTPSAEGALESDLDGESAHRGGGDEGGEVEGERAEGNGGLVHLERVKQVHGQVHLAEVDHQATTHVHDACERREWVGRAERREN